MLYCGDLCERGEKSANSVFAVLHRCGDSTHRCRASGTESLQIFILPTVGANFVRLLFGSPVGELSRSD